MTESLQPDIADMLGRTGRHWAWSLAFGIVTLLAGLATLGWPGPSLVVVAILLGAQLIVTGIFRLAAAFGSDDVIGGSRVLMAVLGVLSLMIGLYAVRHVLITVTALALLLGIFWIVNGAVEMFMAVSYRAMRARGRAAVTGAFSMLSGAAVLVYPSITLLALTVILGLWLLMFGGLEINVAFQCRSLSIARKRMRGARFGQ